MKGLPWFRFYTDFLTNERIQLLSFDDRAHYVGILCLKGRGSLDKFQDDPELQLMAIAKSLGLDPLTADEVRFRLIKVGLIEDNWEPIGWDERQYESDSSTDRVRKFRAKKANKKQPDSRVKRPCNVSVTAPDTDTDTDADTEKEITPAGLNVDAWAAYERHRRDIKAKRLTKQGTAMAQKKLAALPHDDQMAVVELSIANGWTGLFPERKGSVQKLSYAEQLKKDLSSVANG